MVFSYACSSHRIRCCHQSWPVKLKHCFLKHFLFSTVEKLFSDCLWPVHGEKPELGCGGKSVCQDLAYLQSITWDKNWCWVTTNPKQREASSRKAARKKKVASTCVLLKFYLPKKKATSCASLKLLHFQTTHLVWLNWHRTGTCPSL